ncbi:HNH endonuclease [Enterococcus sp. ALS3]|uniref:HNH endonuclease n=1 Tax=Enterococcus alishanensis TaxID=1303817 RepID=A0ABS6TG38_9ENTE|nr:HNH endonuclease [Enterococcus alishanensis]MBV7391838.1 HNH endonuclease [Enterococcus alishanensis]
MRNKERYFSILQDYRAFAEKLSVENGKVKKTSSKGAHYARFLLYLTVLYEEIFQEDFGPLDSFVALKKIMVVENLKDFTTFNREEHNFYSATINCFSAYLTRKQTRKEEFADDRLNFNLASLTVADEILISEEIKEFQVDNLERPKKILYQKNESYPRSPHVSYLAKIRSNWSCELNRRHRTFISQADGKNFVEVHHLVPMAVQDYYQYTLDFTDNVITLCPNCHRLVHLGSYQERATAITKLLKDRETTYQQHGIEINQKLLLSFYGVV